MKKVLLTAAVMALLIVSPVEAQVSGIVLEDAGPVHEEIIVTGIRSRDAFPLPYEAHIVDDGVRLTAERDSSGRTTYTFTRPLFGALEFHKEWDDGRGRSTIPEHNRPDTRWVPFRW